MKIATLRDSFEFLRKTGPCFAHLGFCVELPLLRRELFLEVLNFVGRVRENVLHLFLMVGVDFLELELSRTTQGQHTALC